MAAIVPEPGSVSLDEQVDEAERMISQEDLIGGASRLEDLRQQALSARDLDVIQRIAVLATASQYRSRSHWRRFEQLALIAEGDVKTLERENSPGRIHVAAAWLSSAMEAKPLGTASIVAATIGSVGFYTALWGVPFLGWAGALWPLAVALGGLGLAFDRERNWARFGLVWGLFGTGFLVVLIYITLSWTLDF